MGIADIYVPYDISFELEKNMFCHIYMESDAGRGRGGAGGELEDRRSEHEGWPFLLWSLSCRSWDMNEVKYLFPSLALGLI